MRKKNLFALTRHSIAHLVGVTAVLLASMHAPQAGASTINILGDSRTTGNCIAFGCPGSYDPFMGFVYKNIDAFDLAAGDTIAYDTAGVENDNPLIFNIYMGRTTVNGGTVLDADGLVQVATSATPADPNGNAVADDFELVFTVDSPFSFSGGGLVIAFETVGSALSDTTFDQNLRRSSASDSSDLFVGRFYGLNTPGAGSDLTDASLKAQADAGFDTSSIGNVIITATGTGTPAPEPATLALLGLGLAAARLARRRRSPVA